MSGQWSTVDVRGRSYRLHTPDTNHSQFGAHVLRNSEDPQAQCSAYEDEPDCMAVDDEEVAGIEQTNDGRFRLSLPVPAVFHRFVVGKGGQTRKTLERDTETSISVSKPNSASDEIVVHGGSARAVGRAKARLDIVVASAARTLVPTHFINLPLQAPAWAERLGTFQTASLGLGARGVDSSIMVPPSRLHLTLLVLRLHTAEQEAAAVQLLRQLAPQLYDALGTTSLILPLRGIEYMNDDPGEVDVLYAKVVSSPPLDTFCRTLIQAFIDAKLLDDDEIDQQRLYDTDGKTIRLKLHATLLNSKYSRARDGGGKGPTCPTPRAPFDARPLFQTLGEFDFGSERVPALHLSSLGGAGASAVRAREQKKAGNIVSSQYAYSCVHEMPLP